MPGPFYTGQADFAFMGPSAAPGLVALDDERVDVIFRQPRSREDVAAAMEAVRSDPFSGYAIDGNAHWDLHAVREWWGRRGELRQHITEHLLSNSWYPWPSQRPQMHAIARDWLQHLERDAEAYLRQYAYFLQWKVWPSTTQALPEL